MIPVYLSPKEIHILMQALRILMDADADAVSIADYAKGFELNRLRDKLQNAKS